MKEKILIVGYIRSGHHFLADSIGLNSEKFSGFIWLNIDKPNLRKTIPGIIYKNHGYSFWHENYMDQLLKEFYILGPIRDGKDVMVSTFYFKKAYTRHTLPDSMTFQEFLRYNDSVYIKHWVEHIRSWMRQPIHFVRYEDMSYDFDRTMKQIFEVIEEKKENFIKPEFGDYYSKNNIQRKGIVGDWKNYFEKEDEELFYSIAGDLMKNLGYT